jgi:hypothetical protein
MRNQYTHNYLLDRFIAAAADSDLVIANGDYSCDTGAIGIADDGACESAAECSGKLRRHFNGRFYAVFGDHELGKKMLGADRGGLRLGSLQRAEKELALASFWRKDLGNYVLLGVLSTLIALPVYAEEALPEEIPGWQRLREEHLVRIREAFVGPHPDQRVILFCHDPTALPFLAQDEEICRRIGQVERTIIGHLYTPLLLWPIRLLSWMPTIHCLGHTTRRLTAALAEAGQWRQFRPLLCPSTSGCQLLKDGGYYTAELEPGASRPAEFTFHPLPWK